MTTTTMTAITPEKALHLMNRAIEERGEHYVYPRQDGGVCLYWHEGDQQPGCLIGLMMSYIGPVPDEEKGVADDAVRALYPETSADVLVALAEAQVTQDNSRPWGQAREVFLNVLRRRGVTLT